MAINAPGRRAPYAPPATVLHVIHHFQQREVPDILTDTILGQIGVKDSVMLIVKQALMFLNLTREDGTTTDNFRALRYATDEDRPKLFRDLLTAAYSDVFAIRDPETATRPELLNAFRPFSPASQHDRMITLFLALCQEAGYKVAQTPRQPPQQGPRPPRLAATPKGAQQQNRDADGAEPQHRQTPPSTPPGLLFGVSDSDIAKLTEDEFAEVWAALGKVARARTRGVEPSAQPEQEGGDAP